MGAIWAWNDAARADMNCGGSASHGDIQCALAWFEKWVNGCLKSPLCLANAAFTIVGPGKFFRAFGLLLRGAKASEGVAGTALALRSYVALHASENMADRMITAGQVQAAVQRGTRYFDRKNGTFNYVLQGGYASGDSLIVATNVFTGRIVTVIRKRRFNPGVMLPGGAARYLPTPP